MTAKEKAEELFEKMLATDKLDNYSFVGVLVARECALIAVEEIIKHSPNKPIEEYDPIQYFKEVKKEIENL